MDDPMSIGVKDAITKFPKLEELLNQYEIGCGPCPVGACMLRDVVSIHDLAPDQEAAFMEKAHAIIEGRDVDLGGESPAAESGPKEFNYSPPVRRLVHEHVYIKYVVYAIPGLAEKLDLEKESDRDLVFSAIDFVKNYADRYHHAKEEDILFKYFDESQDIIQVMYEDHRTGRGYVKNILEAIDERDLKKARANLIAYYELLSDHIRREDEILYVWMDKDLSAEQVKEMEAKFDEVEKEFGDRPREHEAFALSLADNSC